jgi:dTDP-glucose 4,6-dehydratase
MRYLITGGCGFIGSHFVRFLLREREDTEEIRNLDLMTYAADPRNLRDVEGDARYRFVQGDVRDPAAVAPAAEGVDWIVNFAAETHVDRSILEAGSFVQTDVYGAYVLLEAARRNNSRFLQISTDEVYGSADEGRPFREVDPLRPRNPYAASKAGGELICRSYHVTHGLHVVITRCSNNLGPNQHIEKMIPLFTTNAFLGEPLPLYGDGRNVRDWIWVGDHCSALSALLDRGQAGEVYNIAGANERENLEVTEAILRAVGETSSEIRPVPDRPGHDRRYSMDASRLRSLGWEPRVSFEEALERTVSWYRENPGWWQSRRADPSFQAYYRAQYRTLFGGDGEEGQT